MVKFGLIAAVFDGGCRREGTFSWDGGIRIGASHAENEPDSGGRDEVVVLGIPTRRAGAWVGGSKDLLARTLCSFGKYLQVTHSNFFGQPA